jgi:hypothetical protein
MRYKIKSDVQHYYVCLCDLKIGEEIESYKYDDLGEAISKYEKLTITENKCKSLHAISKLSEMILISEGYYEE